MKQFLMMSAISMVCAGSLRAQDTASVAKAFSLEASYIADSWYNLFGGLDQGAAYMGAAAVGFMFNTEKAGFWKGGNLYVKGQSLHGKSLSETYVGDVQVVSNIDGGTHLYLHELWYKHSFEHVDVTIGLQDLNVDAVVSDAGSFFLNGSFGIPSVIADNVPSSLFPLTTLGISAHVALSDTYSVLVALYDGKPTHFDANPYNTDWKFAKTDGLLSLYEFQAQLHNTGMYKIGVYHHTGLQEYNAQELQYEPVFDVNYGLYTVIDQGIWKHSTTDAALTAFSQIMLSPKRINNHYAYIGGGLVYSGIGKKQASVGMAVAHARFQESVYAAETALELSCSVQMNKHISIQPDVQYIMNPAATDEKLVNALAAGVRLVIEL